MNVAREVAAQLRAEILSGTIAIGDRIASEYELMSRFSVSRQTVREALRELGANCLIFSRRGPGGGAFVAAPDLERMSELMNGAGAMMAAGAHFAHEEVCVAIFEIEAACCRLAASRRDPTAFAAMRRAIDEAASAAPREPRAYFDAHIGFNSALWTASGNGPLAFVMQAFMQSLRLALPNSEDAVDLREYDDFLHRNHTAILAALEAGSGTLAVERLKENLAFWLAHPPRAAEKRPKSIR